LHILLLIALLTISVTILVRRIKSSIIVKSSEIDIYNFELRMSPLLKWISLIGSALFGLFILLMTLFQNETVTIAVYTIFSTLFLLNLSLFLFFATGKIKILGDNIICYSLFSRPKQYTFDMVKKLIIKDAGSVSKVFVYSDEEKLFALNSSYEYFDILMQRFGERKILTEYKQAKAENNRRNPESININIKPRSSALSLAALLTVLIGVLSNLSGVIFTISILTNIGILVCVTAVILSIIDLMKSGSYKPPQKSDGSLVALIVGLFICFLNVIIYL